jgi:hypothetical protein
MIFASASVTIRRSSVATFLFCDRSRATALASSRAASSLGNSCPSISRAPDPCMWKKYRGIRAPISQPRHREVALRGNRRKLRLEPQNCSLPLPLRGRPSVAISLANAISCHETRGDIQVSALPWGGPRCRRELTWSLSHRRRLHPFAGDTE